MPFLDSVLLSFGIVQLVPCQLQSRGNSFVYSEFSDPDPSYSCCSAYRKHFCMQKYVEYMSRYTGQPKDIVSKDVGRNRYFDAEQAIEYGLVDHVVTKRGSRVMEKRDYEGALRASEAQNPRRSSGGGPSAEGGY